MTAEGCFEIQIRSRKTTLLQDADMQDMGKGPKPVEEVISLAIDKSLHRGAKKGKVNTCAS